jgi:glucose-6-phosphate isomerase
MSPPAALLSSLRLAPHSAAHAFDAAVGQLDARGFRTALFDRNPAAWSEHPEIQAKIGDRLGWLASPETMSRELDRLVSFADDVRRDGFTDVVLLGMGGSSLAPEVLRTTAGVQPGWPRFTVLDAVNPEHLRSATVDVHRTLFVLASKSGSTIEPNVMAAYFRQRLIDGGVTRWADHFVAITDPGTALDTRATTEHFREVFRNPADIGGRYSAISFFGLVPAALMGLDVGRIVEDARVMFDAARDTPVASNPALGLGALAGAAAAHGRDKLTLLLPPELESFGRWVEQVIAESTGKQGRGIIPIAGEPLGDPGEFGPDRLIVRVRVAGRQSDSEQAVDRLVSALADRGTPVAEITVERADVLGGEFVRWELATAAAGAILGINPFDEPNVQQAKDATRALLDNFTRDGHLPVPEPDAEFDHASFTLTTAARRALAGKPADRLLALVARGDYVGVLAYLPEGPEITSAVRRFRGAVRAQTHAATMFGYGPRYLHSTGQLHKGGPNTGVFLILTAPGHDASVPGEPFSFGVLELAQALGDLASLDQTGRRALHVHLPRADTGTLERVLTQVLDGGARRD